MINLIKPQVRLSLSSVFFLCIGVPFLFIDNLGILTTIFLSLASICLFYVFAIMPKLLKQDYINMENQYPSRYQRRIRQDEKKQIDDEYSEKMKYWIGAALILLVSGVIAHIVFR